MLAPHSTAISNDEAMIPNTAARRWAASFKTRTKLFMNRLTSVGCDC